MDRILVQENKEKTGEADLQNVNNDIKQKETA